MTLDYYNKNALTYSQETQTSKFQDRRDMLLKYLEPAAIDHFGKDAKIEITDDSHFILSAEVAINVGLIRWILNWGSDAVVLYPESLIKDVKIEIEKMYLMYEMDFPQGPDVARLRTKDK